MKLLKNVLKGVFVGFVVTALAATTVTNTRAPEDKPEVVYTEYAPQSHAPVFPADTNLELGKYSFTAPQGTQSE